MHFLFHRPKYTLISTRTAEKQDYKLIVNVRFPT